jgi:hypothetical protein
MLDAVDFLVVLMSLAGQDDDVFGSGLQDGGADGGPAVELRRVWPGGMPARMPAMMCMPGLRCGGCRW